MKRRLMSPVMVGLLFCTAMTADLHGATLTGVVRNGTLGRVEAGVTVQMVHHSAQSAEVLTDTTDAEGRFSFTYDGAPSAEVPTMLSAEYKGVPYRSDRITDASQPVEIAVYESTASDANLSIISHHFIVDASGGRATQVIIFQNTGDRTYRTGTGHGHGIEVPLPVGVTQSQSEIPGVHTHGPILVDSRPVPPGRMQLAFTTPIPQDGRLVQRLKYATPSVDMFVTPSDHAIGETTLADLGPVTIGERTFRRLSGSDFAAGSEVVLAIRHQAAVTAPGGDWLDGDGKGPWALGGVALGALLALAYLRMGSKGRITVEADEAMGPEVRRAALLEQIADLDDRLERGEIAADEHERRREAMKAEVVDLTRAATG